MIERKRRIHDWHKQYMEDTIEEEEGCGEGSSETTSPEKPVGGEGGYQPAAAFKVSDVLDFQKTRPGDEPVWWLNSLRLARHRLPPGLQQALKKRYDENSSFNVAEAVGLLLMKRNPHIEIRPAFFPLHKMSPFAKAARPCPNCDLVYQTLLCVPSSALLEESDVKEVCSAVRLSIRDALLQVTN